MAGREMRAALTWCGAVAMVIALALWQLVWSPGGAAAPLPVGAVDGARLVHSWDRTFTCGPTPSWGVAFATPPAAAADAAYFAADRPRCAGYVTHGAPHGPVGAGPAVIHTP